MHWYWNYYKCHSKTKNRSLIGILIYCMMVLTPSNSPRL